jgi:hypothetical protein
MNPKTIFDVEDEINLGMILRTMEFKRQRRKKTPAKKDDLGRGPVDRLGKVEGLRHARKFYDFGDD